MIVIEISPKRFSLIAIIILFVWISFFPLPLQEKYHLALKVFLGLAFMALLIEKRTKVFKLSDWPLWFFLLTIGINIFFAQQKNVALRTYLDLAIPIFSIYYLFSEGLSLKSELIILARIITIIGMLVAWGGILGALLTREDLGAQ